MNYRVKNGWLYGKLPGPAGPIEVHRDPSPPFIRMTITRPNLVLHTTETDHIASWQYPPQFTVGEGIVVQHKPLWAKGEALRGDTTNDPYAMQVEIVGHSQLGVWLPPPSSLEPLVALVAWLHSEHLIPTGLERPWPWSIRLDDLPAAVEGYYRRHAGLWPRTPGVYGHVEIPDNTHWDPGSFDYPTFFGMVQGVLEGDDEMAFTEWQDGVEAYLSGDALDDTWSLDKKKGWRFARWAGTNPKGGGTATHVHGIEFSGQTGAAP